MKVAVCQIGARRHYAVPVALERAGLLAALYTDGCRDAGLWRWVDRLLPGGLRRGPVGRMLDREVGAVPGERIVNFEAFGLWRAWRGRRHRTAGASLRGYAEANARFNRCVTRYGLGEADAVYVFNAAGREILEHASGRGLHCVVDQTMAPFAVVEPMLAEERQRWEGWEKDVEDASAWRPLAERERAEWDLAERIVCGSEYVADALGQMADVKDRCRVVPHGIEATQPVDAQAAGAEAPAGRPLRVLFAGTLGLRKGVGYLVEAAERLRNEAVEFRAVGPSGIEASAIDRLRRCIEWLGPVPRSHMSEHYRWADVLVLPTLAEGSANVCYEAMAHARPVITTPNAGSVVRDGEDGYVVPIRDAEALAERITALADDRDKLRAMGQRAGQRIGEYTWERYGQELAGALDGGDDPPIPGAMEKDKDQRGRASARTAPSR